MLSLPADNTKVFLTLLSGLAFSCLFMLMLPFAEGSALFLLALPLGLFALIFMALNARAMLALIFLSRALLDPLLNLTKSGVGGIEIGFGAAINLLVILLAIFFRLRNRQRVHNLLFKLWMLFIFASFITLFYTPEKGEGVKLLLNLISYAAMISMPFFLVNDVRDQRFWLKILIFSTVFPILVADAHILMGRMAQDRVQATFTHPNILAFYVVFAIVVVFYALKSHVLKLTALPKNLLKIYLLNLFIVLIATKTRNAWIGCWVFFLFYGLFREKRYLIYTILVPPVFFLVPAVQDRIRDLFSGTGSNLENNLNSYTWRMLLWQRAIEFAKERIFFGYGLASFKPMSIHFFPEKVAPHNVYVEVLFETGIMGLTAFAGIFIGAIRYFWKHLRTFSGPPANGWAIALSYLISYAFSCAGDNMQYYLVFNWYFWFFIGLLARWAYLHDKKIVRYHPVV